MMKKVFCFIDKELNFTGELKKFIEDLDNSGYEVYLNMDFAGKDHNPSDILYSLDINIDRNNTDDQYTFLSNINNLTQVVYRLYHQVFHNFIYFHQENVDSYSFSEVYLDVFHMHISEAEKIYKSIYSNLANFSIKEYSCNVENYSNFIRIDQENTLVKDTSKYEIMSNTNIRKYYYIKGNYYLFEPILTEESIVIRDSKNSHDTDKEFRYPGASRMRYMYSYNTDITERLCFLLDDLSYKSMNDIYDILEQMEKDMAGYYKLVFNMSCCVLEDISLSHGGKDILKALLLLSFLMQITKKTNYFKRYLELSLHSEVLSCDNRYFLWNQAKRYVLSSCVDSDSTTNSLMKDLYQKAYYEYLDLLKGDLTPIPLEERDSDTIVVLTIQFLSERHAPTRTTLERCYTLAKRLGKKVLLINTREQLTRKGMLLLYMPTLGNVMEQYNNLEHYQYNDCQLPYYQPSGNMPSIEEIHLIIDKIRELKPSFIFSIGNGSITADLCGKIVPQAAIGVAFSILPTTMATFSVIGKNLSELEWDKYIQDGYDRKSIIESTFTFELIQKRKKFTREEFGIPTNSFLLVTVGIRLDTEIDDEFIETINQTFPWGTHIVFAGYFERYQSYCERYPEFQKHSTFIGYCDDMLALMEICDLYVNPNRLGGGFSIIEAFHEGKPGVTINSGDISIASGDQFTVKDYKEMTEIIKRYMEDKNFYLTMAMKAKEREKQVTDSKKAMLSIVQKIQSNPLFF